MIHLLAMRRSGLGLGMVVLSACGARSGFDVLESGNEGPVNVISVAGRAALASDSAGAGAHGGGTSSNVGSASQDTCVPFQFTLIDDVEDGQNDKMVRPGLMLAWFAGSKRGSAVQLGSQKLFPARDSSRVAMHASTKGTTLSLGFQMTPCAHIGSPRAIAFWARANAPTWASVEIASQSNTSVSDGGLCYSTLCSPALDWIQLTSEWHRFELSLGSFTPQPPGGLEAFRSLELSVDAASMSGPVELWMDDPEFLR